MWKTLEKMYRALWNSDHSAFARDNREKLNFVLSMEAFNGYAVTTI